VCPPLPLLYGLCTTITNVVSIFVHSSGQTGGWQNSHPLFTTPQEFNPFTHFPPPLFSPAATPRVFTCADCWYLFPHGELMSKLTVPPIFFFLFFRRESERDSSPITAYDSGSIPRPSCFPTLCNSGADGCQSDSTPLPASVLVVVMPVKAASWHCHSFFPHPTRRIASCETLLFNYMPGSRSTRFFAMMRITL